MDTVARFFVGIDLHRTVVQVAVVDGEGGLVEETRWKLLGHGDEAALLGYVRRWEEGGRYAVEALGLNRWLVNAMLAGGLDVVVADPIKLGLKTLGKKTDRRDALELARRLRLGDLDAYAWTYYPGDAEYGVRKVVRTRRELVGMRQKLVNQIRALLNAYRVAVPAGPLTGKRKLEWLRRCELPTEDMGKVMGCLVDSLEGIVGSITELDAWVEEMACRDERVLELRKLSGVGSLTALALVYELGDVARFRRTREVASYAGLVPRVSQSADRSHHGRLTKRGNRELRFLLGQWAVRLLTRDPVVQAWARPQLRRMHKNKVRTSLARKLLVGVAASWRRQEAFDLAKCLGQMA